MNEQTREMNRYVDVIDNDSTEEGKKEVSSFSSKSILFIFIDMNTNEFYFIHKFDTIISIAGGIYNKAPLIGTRSIST